MVNPITNILGWNAGSVPQGCRDCQLALTNGCSAGLPADDCYDPDGIEPHPFRNKILFNGKMGMSDRQKFEDDGLEMVENKIGEYNG